MLELYKRYKQARIRGIVYYIRGLLRIFDAYTLLLLTLPIHYCMMTGIIIIASFIEWYLLLSKN